MILPVITAGGAMSNANTHPQKATWHRPDFGVLPRQETTTVAAI